MNKRDAAIFGVLSLAVGLFYVSGLPVAAVYILGFIVANAVNSLPLGGIYGIVIAMKLDKES